MEVFTCAQGTPEWHEARRGIPTASEFATVMAKGEGKVRRTYLLKLAGEILTETCADSYSNGHMERGQAMEEEARELYTMKHDAEPDLVGFIRAHGAGCSPDALLGGSGLLEVKTQLPHLLIETLLRDKFPAAHVAQCQGALWVTGREWIDIVIYWPKLPLFVKRAHRDEAYIANLAAEVSAFNDDLAELVEQVRRYGQPEAVAA